MNKNHNEVYSPFANGIEALTKGLRVAFILFVAIIAILLGWYIFIKGYFVVESQEVVLLSKFGKLTEECSTDWYWRFPKPIYSRHRIPLTPQKLNINNFWIEETNKGFAKGSVGTSFSPGRNGYLLSADTNIFHTKWEVIYKVSNPKKYFTLLKTPNVIAKNKILNDDITKKEAEEDVGARGPKTLLENIIVNVILKVTAKTKIEDALYDNSNYKQEIEIASIKAIENLDVGIKILNVLPITKPTAPINCINAFQKVTVVRQIRKRVLTEAEQYRIKTEGLAEVEKTKIEADAETYKIKVVSEIKAEEKYFNQILEEYNKNPYIKDALYIDVISEIFSKVKAKYIFKDKKNGSQQIRIKINPEPQIKEKEENK